MEFKNPVPESAKDARLNFSSIFKPVSLDIKEALACAYVAAITANDQEIAGIFSESLDDETKQGAVVAASLMGMTNVWYSFLDMAGDPEIRAVPPRFRMLGYSGHGGVGARLFEMMTLAASIIGKCKSCISAHVDGLKKEGASSEAIAEIARIAAIVNSSAVARRFC